MTNHLHYGDNLTVLREKIASESVDLVYLDPPFNSNASYIVLFKSSLGDQSVAQIEAFDDTWHWGDEAEAAFQSVRRSGNTDVAGMLEAMRSFLGTNDMMAYLAMMAVRLVELHRVLKPTGSLYLHCDPTASHYLKILLDAVFGKDTFLNEIIWKRTFAHGSSQRYGPVHDTIFYYAKNGGHVWRDVRIDHEATYISKHFRQFDPARNDHYQAITLTGAGASKGDSGKPWRGVDPTLVNRHWALPGKILASQGIEGGTVQEKLDALDAAGRIVWPTRGGTPRLKWFVSDLDGMAVPDIWTDIPPISANAKERLGYPTQKPVALLERILSASSNPGDVVLDPFCGCGTTVHAAEKLGRAWIGIDITHLAIGLIEKRLKDAWRDSTHKPRWTTHGVPQDLDGARELFARDDPTKKEFEKWALSLIDAQPWRSGKKGADGGIDGILPFGLSEKAVVSVKGGKDRQRNHIDQLKAVVDRERAQIGVFLTLEEPTKPMLAEAAGAGHFTADGLDRPVPKIQIVTIAQAMALRDRAVQLPLRRSDTFKRAAREQDPTRQRALDL